MNVIERAIAYSKGHESQYVIRRGLDQIICPYNKSLLRLLNAGYELQGIAINGMLYSSYVIKCATTESNLIWKFIKSKNGFTKKDVGKYDDITIAFIYRENQNKADVCFVNKGSLAFSLCYNGKDADELEDFIKFELFMPQDKNGLLIKLRKDLESGRI